MSKKISSNFRIIVKLVKWLAESNIWFIAEAGNDFL